MLCKWDAAYSRSLSSVIAVSHLFERMRTAGVAKIATSHQWLQQRLSSGARHRRPTAAVCSLAITTSSSAAAAAAADYNVVEWSATCISLRRRCAFDSVR